VEKRQEGMGKGRDERKREGGEERGGKEKEAR